MYITQCGISLRAYIYKLQAPLQFKNKILKLRVQFCIRCNGNLNLRNSFNIIVFGLFSYSTLRIFLHVMFGSLAAMLNGVQIYSFTLWNDPIQSMLLTHFKDNYNV